MKTLNYKGYQGAVEFEDGSLFVRVLHIDDVLVARFTDSREAEKVFHELVDEYIGDCKELGRSPSKPFRGTFNVRVGTDLHRRAAMMSSESGISLNSWVSDAIAEKLDCDRLTDRVENVFTIRMEEARIMQFAKSALQQTAKPEKHRARVEEIKRFALVNMMTLHSETQFDA